MWEIAMGPAFSVAAIAAATSAVLVDLLRRRGARTLGLVDIPNARSSHRTAMPRGGGLGVLAGVTLALIAARALFPGELSGKAFALVGCSLIVGFIGLIDDRASLPAIIRLGFHLGAAAILVEVVGPFRSLPLPKPLDAYLWPNWIAVGLTVLWVVAVTNFFNFMDGVDGLAGGQAVASCAGIVLAGFSADAVGVAAALGGASVGFLFHNWPPAGIFMGDVGSGSIGFLLGGLPLLAPPEKRPAAVLAVAIGLTFFVLDPVLTLLRRGLRREALMKAHREHLYQRLIPVGTSGQRVTKTLLTGGALLSMLGAMAYQHAALGWIAVCVSMVLFSIEFVFASRA